MESYTSTVIREGLSFGEAPRWHAGRLWYSDFYRRRVASISPDGADERLEHTVPGQPSGLGWLPSGDLLCVSMTDHRILRFSQSGESTFADISRHCGFWANDMLVSSAGYSYVGDFGFDLDTLLMESGIEGLFSPPPPTTNLVVLDPEGNVVQVVPDMAFPNGTVITPDAKTLIVAETMANRLSAFDISLDGTLTNRRVWAQLELVFCDGICLDSEGQIWVANAATNKCLRVREGGEITGEVTTTETAFACALGGDQRTTLFIMTAASSDRFKADGATLARIETAEVPVPGTV